MKIGQVATAAGVGISAVRFYERQGLLPEPARQPSGYRMYSQEAVVTLRFIRGAKELGFSLKGIRELLSLERDAGATAGDIKALAEQKLADLNEKIRVLRRMRRALQTLVEECPGGGPTSCCSILGSLADEKHGYQGKS